MFDGPVKFPAHDRVLLIQAVKFRNIKRKNEVPTNAVSENTPNFSLFPFFLFYIYIIILLINQIISIFLQYRDYVLV